MAQRGHYPEFSLAAPLSAGEILPPLKEGLVGGTAKVGMMARIWGGPGGLSENLARNLAGGAGPFPLTF